MFMFLAILVSETIVVRLHRVLAILRNMRVKLVRAYVFLIFQKSFVCTSFFLRHNF